MRNPRLRYFLIFLLIEKSIQHSLVTLAFYFDIVKIRETVAVPYEYLMLSGMLVAILFILSLWGILRAKQWTMTLIMALALFDLIGEFVAQGTVMITYNVSFIVAFILLLVSLMLRNSITEQSRSYSNSCERS